MSHCLRSTLFDEVYVHLLPAGNVGLLVPPFIATEIPAFWGDKTFGRLQLPAFYWFRHSLPLRFLHPGVIRLSADCSCQHD